MVSQEYPPQTAKGGIGTQARAKAHGFSALGHEVCVISRGTDRQRHEYSDGPVHVIRVAPSPLAGSTEVADWVSHSLAVAAELESLHAAKAFDIADFPEWAAEAYVHLINRTAWNRIPTVIQLHGPLVMLAHTIGWPAVDSEFYRIGTHMEGACVRLADAVYSSSACSAEWCARYYGLERAATPIIHSGIDTDHFAPRDVPKMEHSTIVFAGKIAWNKGVGVLLDAACELAREFHGLRLRMLGRGDPSVIAELRRRASARGLADLLELPGFIPHDRLPYELSRAHVFAAPSEYEGGPGFVYLEAMACGLPAVACEGSGAAEVIDPGRTGALVAPRDARALASALRHLLDDPKEFLAAGRRARQYVLEHADTRVCLKRLEAFYAQVISRRQP
jgi:glycosyltransferase involved in cell wall biosynthesis